MNVGKVATPLVWEFLKRWPSAEATRHADWKARNRFLVLQISLFYHFILKHQDIADFMNPLGLHKLRAKRITRMSGTD